MPINEGVAQGEVLPVDATIARHTIVGFDHTYSAAVNDLTFANSPTDIFTITGSATTEVRVLKITFSATKQAAANLAIGLIKRSTDNTGGASTDIDRVPHDSNFSAATAVVRAYTANPTTLGTSIGLVHTMRYYFSSGTGLGFGPVTFDFNDILGAPLILRGTSEVLSVNMFGTGISVANNLTSISIEWSEVGI